MQGKRNQPMNIESPLPSAEPPGSSGSRQKVGSLPYRSYILRCWQESSTSVEGSGRATWRFSLLEVGGLQPRRAFPDLQALLAFLAEQTGETAGAQASDAVQATGHP